MASVFKKLTRYLPKESPIKTLKRMIPKRKCLGVYIERKKIHTTLVRRSALSARIISSKVYQLEDTSSDKITRKLMEVCKDFQNIPVVVGMSPESTFYLTVPNSKDSKVTETLAKNVFKAGGNLKETLATACCESKIVNKQKYVHIGACPKSVVVDTIISWGSSLEDLIRVEPAGWSLVKNSFHKKKAIDDEAWT